MLFFVSILPASALGAPERLTYAPKVVELAGRLELQTFPGPPNFESISSGDDMERGYYLRLDHPVTVEPTGKHPEVDNPVREANVKIVQLAMNPEDDKLWARLRKLGKNAHVSACGTLFHRFTGHHHARILLDVESIR